MSLGPVEEVVAELGFDYDTAVIAAMDAQINLMIGAIEILGRTAQAVSEHMVTSFRSVGLPVGDLEQGLEKLEQDLGDSRNEANKLRRAFHKFGDEADDAGGEAEELGEKTKEGAREAEESVDSLIQKLGILGAAYAAIEFAKELGETARQTRVLSAAMGISVESASEWTAVARTVGAEAEDIQDAMVTLSERFLDAANGGQDAKDMLGRLGLAIPRTAAEIPNAEEGLLLLADAFAAIENPAERAAKASELLGDNGVRLLPFLSRGRRGIEEMRKRVRELGGGLSTDGIANIEKFQGALIFVQVAFESLFDKMAKKFLPALTVLTEAFADAVGWFQDVADHSHILEAVFGALGVVMTAFKFKALAAWFAATWPALLAVGAALLLGAAIDDLWVAFEGGDSVIGRVMDSLLGPGQSAAFFEQLRAGWDEVLGFLQGTVAPFFGAMWENIKPSIESVKQTALALFSRVRTAVEPIANMLIAMWERIRGPVTSVLGFIFRAMRFLAVKIGEVFSSTFGWLADKFGELIEWVSAHIQRVVGWLDRLGVLDALGDGADALGNALEGFSFSTDGTGAPAASTGLQNTLDTESVPRAGGRSVTQTNTVNATINLPGGVTEEQARRLGREAAEGALEARDLALLDGAEATA